MSLININTDRYTFRKSKKVSQVTKARDPDRLPPDLLILNRFGIGYPYLKAAWRISNNYDIPAFEVLIASGVISENVWFEAQGLLAQEKARARNDERVRSSLLSNAINLLSVSKPAYSAAYTFTRFQVVSLILIISLCAYAVAIEVKLAFLMAISILTLFYGFNTLLRGMLLASYDESIAKSGDLISVNDEKLPTYTILVALYHEESQVHDLTQQLWCIDWPKHKLDIKLICESDDLETIAAIADANLPPCFDMVLVPPAEPRTKPKALNYALPMAHGQYLVLYDAEDRPSPMQLREAYGKFVTCGPDLACLQAPLQIHNHQQNWLCKTFAIEYMTLFNGILPVLAKWGVPLPLGGTSNHFKTDVLRKVGAWDPYNVTEDADLGIRLFREGYRSETITSPTFEEAPSKLTPWIKQRTRWIKGWMQTILVHNRNPLKLFQDLGVKNALAFHLFLTSIVISVLIHPIFLGLAFYQIAIIPFTDPAGLNSVILGTSVFNLVGGYTTYGLLAYAVIQDNAHSRFNKCLFTLPIYWLLISIAAWRALVHLFLNPHKWEKTPHGLANAKFSLKL